MFELTNEQRDCFALPPILDTWKRIEVKAGPYDHYVTYAYLDGQRIVKVIQVSETPGQEMYREYGVDQMLSADGTRMLPKTDKGKPQHVTAPALCKKTPVGMSLSFADKHIAIVNNTTEQCYYRSAYSSLALNSLKDFSDWAADWCKNTGEKELADIREFAKRAKTHQKFREGDFFRYRIDRHLYGYGRILVDYAKMRKEGVPFWDVFMGKPLCVAVYHIATEDGNVSPEHLARLQMLPSQMVMDNIFYYGECERIGNMPISPDEDNYTIHYGNSIDAVQWNYTFYQCGKTFASLEGRKALYGSFLNHGIGFALEVKLPILLECIKQSSNEPYWRMIHPSRANQDLRNPKFRQDLTQIKQQMGV